jgi:hypothetical protein
VTELEVRADFLVEELGAKREAMLARLRNRGLPEGPTMTRSGAAALLESYRRDRSNILRVLRAAARSFPLSDVMLEGRIDMAIACGPFHGERWN